MEITNMNIKGYTVLTVMVLLFMVPAIAGAVDYKTKYNGIQNTGYEVQTISSEAPATTFQSTSVYSGQWSQDAQPSILNADGSVNTDTYLSGPASAPRRSNTPPPPGQQEDKDRLPVGDAPWVWMAVLAAGYCAASIRKTKKHCR